MRNGAICLTSQIAPFFTNTAPLSAEDRCLVKCLMVEKRLKCFPNNASISHEKVEKRTLNYLIRKIDKTGSADRASGSSRRRSAWTHENIQVVEEPIFSQEGQPIRANCSGERRTHWTLFGLRECSLVCGKHYSKQWWFTLDVLHASAIITSFYVSDSLRLRL